MFAPTDAAIRRALSPSLAGFARMGSGRPTSVFTQSYQNARLLKMAICAPPRHTSAERYSGVYITELGAKARGAAPVCQQEALAG